MWRAALKMRPGLRFRMVAKGGAADQLVLKDEEQQRDGCARTSAASRKRNP